MDNMSPKARFEALAGVTGFDSACVDQVRQSIRLLLPSVNELVRRVDEAMRHDAAPHVLGDLGGEQRERMQSLLASFIMRTINCNFDEDFCNYAAEVSGSNDVPPNLFSVGLTLANDFVALTLPAGEDDPERLASMLSAWNRLTAVLRELTRKQQ